MKTIQIIVSGRVQGVYFRAYTRKQAIKQGITGFVRNNADGYVEIIASAKQDQLDCLVDWCHKGPIMAKVTDVSVNKYQTTKSFSNFEIR